MAITKWQAGPSGTLGNTTGEEMAEGFNALVDRQFIFIEDFGATEESVNSAPAIILALTALRTGQTLTTRLQDIILLLIKPTQKSAYCVILYLILQIRKVVYT